MEKLLKIEITVLKAPLDKDFEARGEKENENRDAGNPHQIRPLEFSEYRKLLFKMRG